MLAPSKPQVLAEPRAEDDVSCWCPRCEETSNEADGLCPYCDDVLDADRHADSHDSAVENDPFFDGPRSFAPVAGYPVL
jgi:hypothetical protein